MPDLIYEAHDRMIRYREDYRGDIVHFALSTKTLVKREPCSKRSLDRLIDFLERGPSEDYTLLGQFNVLAEAEVQDLIGFDVTGSQLGDFIAVAAKAGDAVTKSTKKLSRHGGVTTVYVRKENDFKANSRYAVDRTGSTLVFNYLEPISSDNLNTQYDQPVFSVYVCDK